MTFTIDTNELNNDEVSITENASGELEVTHVPTGNTFVLDTGQRASSIKNIDGGVALEGETGTIPDGDYGIIMSTQLADTETFSVTRVSYHSIGDTDPVTPSPSNTELSIIDGSGSYLTTILSGGGEDTHVTGNPVVSYQNTTGSTQDIVIGVDNGQVNVTGAGEAIDIQANIIGQIE